MRGKQAVDFLIHRSGRITPACAGKTHKEGEKNMIIEDHPRVCGENYDVSNPWFWWQGSPPRVRGKLT